VVGRGSALAASAEVPRSTLAGDRAVHAEVPRRAGGALVSRGQVDGRAVSAVGTERGHAGGFGTEKAQRALRGEGRVSRAERARGTRRAERHPLGGVEGPRRAALGDRGAVGALRGGRAGVATRATDREGRRSAASTSLRTNQNSIT
jgi:hypothetical protein